MQAKAQEAFLQFVEEQKASQGEKKPSVMEYLGLKKKVSDLQQIAHAMQMKVLASTTYLFARGDGLAFTRGKGILLLPKI